MKTKHEKIVEIGKGLYDSLNALYHIEDGTTNKYDMKMDKSGVMKFIELFATAIEQLEPEGGVNIEDLFNGVSTYTTDEGILLMSLQEFKWALEDYTPPPQQPSEGEISDIFLNNTVDYYGTAYMIFDGFKAAIKELNR